MSKNLRNRILLLLEEHARTGSPYFKGEIEIADCLGVPGQEIQRQLDILESQRLISSANSFEGHSARISPQGSLAVEELHELEEEPKAAPQSLQIEDRKTTTAFVSYAWEEETKAWVRELATRLRTDGIDCRLDQWELVPGDQLPEFMDKSVRESDYVLIACTPKYKARSDAREGGVGYEGDIMTSEVFLNRNHRKFIPILKRGRWQDNAPSWLSGKLYIDLSAGFESPAYKNLVLQLHGHRPTAPPLGDGPAFLRPKDAQDQISRRAGRIKDVLSGSKVLIVNDHPDHMAAAMTLLTNSGIKVDVVDNSDDALRMLKSSDFDSVISDMRRGDVPDEGIRFLRRARELGISRPIIFSVALFEPERGVPPYAFGISNYVDELVHLTFDALERERG